ncbi:HIR complex subunit [Coemansia aciculifera]|uniref:Protein HIR n=1 Tax=Coemansia aciculifera TaxID=417176 RepID=A0A9W8IMP1_9FUNG|nr:HIR complex subunit [Coemansia aciculifera]KAJ2876458.1 HIR complex subunit [Coemansia aciculifera]
MRITKPEWLRHDGDKKKLSAIFSLDFHPDGTRLATSGMDNKIRLWNTQAISDTTSKEQQQPKLLSTLSSHSGAVLCVRFSHGDGRYLASGADDMVVLIWERDDSAIQGNLSSSAESWRPMRRLTGHESDVCDLAWSPNNRYLATCGLDNSVLVWDGATFERVAKLTGHEQFVKGLTFDPAGKYLATQSDDKTMRIWRTSDWAQHAVVRRPFEDNMFSTYFRRPSWSPDGDCVAAANAANGKVPVAAVISRDEWTADLSFVGHRAAIEAVRFNPRVFTQADSSSVACVCAAGGQDRGVSVWLTSQHMPIAAATHLFTGNLMDLAWHTVASDSVDESSVVAYLAACSYDGTVALLEFTQAELGRPISAQDQEAMLKKHGWIKRSDDSDADAASKRPILVESVEQLRLEELGSVDRDSRIAQIMDGCLLPSVANTKEPTPQKTADAPVPVLTKNGKKRVAPVFVRPLGGYAAQSSSTNQQQQQQQQQQPEGNNIIGVGNSNIVADAPLLPRPAPALVDRVAVDAPIWIEARALGTRTIRASDEKESNADVAITATVQPLGRQTLIHAQSISAARVHLSVPRVVAHVTCTATTTLAVLAAYNQSAKRTANKALSASKIVSTAKLGAVMWTKHLTGGAVTLLAASDVVAAASCTDGTLHLFDSESGARLLPPIMCEAHLAHLRCVGKFCLALDCVGQLTVWDLDRVYAVVDRVSVAPLLYSAELIANNQPDDDEDPALVKAPKRHKPSVALTAADVCPATGSPIVCLSDGRSFTYHLQLRSWLCIGDPASYAGSEFAPRPPLLASTKGAQQAFTPTLRTRLGYIQETGWHQRNLSCKRAEASEPEGVVPVEKRRLITLDHLEHQLMSASAIDSPEDVQRYADILARHLARAGDKPRTEFWLRSLLGPALVKDPPPSSSLVWAPTLAGVPKRQLLGRVLPILATNRNLQSIVTEYSDALSKLLQ